MPSALEQKTRAAGNEPILSWEAESGEKTEVRRWKLEVESQKSEVADRKSEVGLKFET